MDEIPYFHNNGNMDTRTALQALAALSQESRLAVFRLLVQAGFGGMSAGKIAEKLQIPAATLSFHLKELTHADLVTGRQQARFVYYSVNYSTMNKLMSYLSENCCNGNPELCAPAQRHEFRPVTNSSRKRKARIA